MQHSKIGTDEHVELYATMVRIRLFEELVKTMMAEARLPGFVHLSIGQEAIAAGVCSSLRAEDKIVTTHRGHGHILAKGARIEPMMAELLGRTGGYCKGKGGSMHIVDFGIGVLGANGIVGGGIPIATGSAMAARLASTPEVTVCFFGDGAVGQGVLYESLNLSALWKLPIVFVCEANGWSEWTPATEVTAGRVLDRATPFEIPGAEVDGNDVLAVRDAAAAAVARARGGDGPTLIVATTYRARGHHEGEEAFTGDYREDVLGEEGWAKTDPIARLRETILADGATAEQLAAVDERERQAVADGLAAAERSPMPVPSDALEDLYA